MCHQPNHFQKKKNGTYVTTSAPSPGFLFNINFSCYKPTNLKESLEDWLNSLKTDIIRNITDNYTPNAHWIHRMHGDVHNEQEPFFQHIPPMNCSHNHGGCHSLDCLLGSVYFH